jgi:Bacterial mobilisation protein (MobC)
MEPVKVTRKKAGRPPKTVRKEIRASIRFTRPEYFIVKEKAAQAGLKPSEYMRHIAIYTLVHPRLTEEQRIGLRMLIGVSNNVNQIAKCCHQEGMIRAMILFESYRPVIDEAINKLKS